jgi:hypothetical protein
MTGRLPDWSQGDLPHPPPFTLRNAMRVIGPSTILLGLSLGAGDWLLGPALVAKHGPGLLWICVLSVILQALLNTEMARYTLATGESVYAGFMRTPPGPRFWGWAYSLLHLAQLGWPGWAAAGGSAMAGLFLGRMPRGEDREVVLVLGYLVFLASVVIAARGTRVQRRIERAELLMMGWMLVFLITAVALIVPREVYARVAAGFLGRLPPGFALPPDVDWPLVTALAAYSGAGGVINATLTHWLRDRGFGMAGSVGFVPAAIGAERVPLTPAGAVFPGTEANLAKWSGWWSYLRADFWFLWTPGCLIAMALPVLLAVAVVAPQTAMSGLGTGVVLAQALGQSHGIVFWMLTLLTGAWILVSTQVGITSGFARSVTDILWTSGLWSTGAQPGAAGTLYYAVLGVFMLAGCLVLPIANPLSLVLIGANLAALNFVVLAAHTLWVNRRLLPAEARPSVWREAAVAAGGVFFGVLAAQVLARPSALLGLFGN